MNEPKANSPVPRQTALSPVEAKPDTLSDTHSDAAPHELLAASVRRGGALQRSELLAMQSVVGNRATRTTMVGNDASRLSRANASTPVIQREAPAEPAPKPAADPKPAEDPKPAADMVNVVKAEVKQENKDPVKIVEKGDNIIARAPKMNMNAVVALKPNVNLGTTQIDVGWVQTLVSSNRTHVYSKGGNVVRKVILPLTSMRDALSEDGLWVPKAIPEPWYDFPQKLMQEVRKTETKTEDQPGDPAPKRNGDATLTAFEGADKFVVSLKSGTDPKNLTTHRSFAWEVPWDVKVDASWTGTGGSLPAPSSVSSPVEPKDKRMPNDVAKLPESKLTTFETDEEAIAGLGRMGLEAFVKELPRHKQHANNSYWKMVTALWKSDKRIRVELTPEKLGSSRTTTMNVKLVSDKTVDLGEVESDGKVHSAVAHTVYEPPNIDKGHRIQVVIDGIPMATLQWPYSQVRAQNLEKHETFSKTVYHLRAWIA